MKIAHHLDDATVMSFAAGALTPAIAVVVSSHISMCPACRRKLENAEAVGGALFEAENKVQLSHGSVNN
ncbi:MAG: ChrR family anti-sigma-E factor, partial [Aestuariivirgaceae bacterium]